MKQKKTKETKTHSNGKRLNIVCGVTVVPDIFLSIINSYGGIDDVRKQRLWPAVKRDLKIKYPSSGKVNDYIETNSNEIQNNLGYLLNKNLQKFLEQLSMNKIFID